MQRELIATAAFGLEAVVRREIEKLGYDVVKTEDGKVTFRGHEEAICRSNLWLRSADRVLLKMDEFPAVTFEELFQRMAGIPWEELIPLGGRVIMTCRSVKSALHNEPACQSVGAKAVYGRLMDFYGVPTGADGEGTWPEDEEKNGLYVIRMTLKKDVVTVTVDTTGDGLHKRGYRVKTVEAPIKETMAAALVQLSFYHPDRLLVDFCTGSGTIPIEAALLARNIAPGLARHFTAEGWDIVPEDLWKKARQEAYAAIDYDTPLKIHGMDIDPKAVEAAKANAEAAGVDEDIVFTRGDMAKYEAEGKYGVAVFNPPYGERIGEQEELDHIYKGLRHFMENNPDWSFFMSTTSEEAEKILGRKADRRRKLYNGNLKTTYYQFHGERPPRNE